MSMQSRRAAVAVLAVAAAVVGVWAAGFPRSFHADFPLPGRGWVSGLGPYNEHLVRDVGGLYLALLVLSAAAWRRPSPSALRTAGGAWLVFSTPHFLWHALHLHGFGTADRVTMLGSLGALLVLSALLLLPDRPARAGQSGGRTPNAGTSPPAGSSRSTSSGAAATKRSG